MQHTHRISEITCASCEVQDKSVLMMVDLLYGCIHNPFIGMISLSL